VQAETALGGAIIASLTFYVLLGGADYGGGIWDIFAFGPRAEKQRELIEHAIGPVWEANHVWLILVIVILFTAFPPAFSAIAIALHIPLTLLLIGIVLRGSAFTFRTYDSRRDRVQRRWSRIFSIASIVSPVLLGIVVGSITSGRVAVRGGFPVYGFMGSWLGLFPFAVGLFALSIFAFLAAVYLTVEAGDRELEDDFRKRALISGIAVGALALAVFLLAGKYAPKVREDLGASIWAFPLHLATAICALGTFATLWLRRFRFARFLAAAQVSFILWGWALAQYPFIVVPDVTIYSAAAPKITLRFLLVALGLGSLILFPSFFYLFRVFKGQTAFSELGQTQDAARSDAAQP
jgi:cytochrome d ubiquinol oxidase subunit II